MKQLLERLVQLYNAEQTIDNAFAFGQVLDEIEAKGGWLVTTNQLIQVVTFHLAFGRQTDIRPLVDGYYQSYISRVN